MTATDHVAPPDPPVTRFAIGQTVCRPADVAGNLERILDAVERAREQGARHIAFPELALAGYLTDERFSEAAVKIDHPAIRKLRDASRGIAITLGFIEETPASVFYNSAACFDEGRIRHVHRKIYLPTYGRFDERRYYGGGTEIAAFDVAGTRVAILICGDAWHLPIAYLAAHDGADILIVVAASTREGLLDTCSCEGAWHRICQSYALTLSTFVVFANQAAGSFSDLHAWGGSFIAGPDGNILAQSDTDAPDLVLADLDAGALRRQRIRLPFRRDDSLRHALQMGRDILGRKVRRERFLDGPPAGGEV